MTLDEAKRELTQQRAALEAARAGRNDRLFEDTCTRIASLEQYARHIEQVQRVAAVPTLDLGGVSKRMKELGDADRNLTPLERAEFRTRPEQESEALHRRVAELNAPAGATTTPVDPHAAERRTAIRHSHAELAKSNPVAAAHFRLRNEAAFDDEPPGAA